MLKESRRDVDLIAVEGDSRSPLIAAGLRIPLGPEEWAQVDFDRRDKVSLVAFSVRRLDYAIKLPTLTLQPHCGNVVSVNFGKSGTPSVEMRVFPVSHGDLEGDILDWLARTRSGDPLGEILLPRGTLKPLAARELHLDHADYGRVELKLSRSDDHAFSCRLSALTEALPVAGAGYRSLDVLVKPLAANTLSICFRETEIVIPKDWPCFSGKPA